FSELIEETILAYRQGRIEQLEYLHQAMEAFDQFLTGHNAGLPRKLSRYQHAPAYYGIMGAAFSQLPNLDDEHTADVAIEIEALIERHRVTDWVTNLDVQNRIKQQLDELFYNLERQYNFTLTGDELDTLIEELLEVAKARDRLT